MSAPQHAAGGTWTVDEFTHVPRSQSTTPRHRKYVPPGRTRIVLRRVSAVVRPSPHAPNPEHAEVSPEPTPPSWTRSARAWVKLRSWLRRHPRLHLAAWWMTVPLLFAVLAVVLAGCEWQDEVPPPTEPAPTGPTPTPPPVSAAGNYPAFVGELLRGDR